MRFVWNITIFAGSILLCNQLIHVNNLYRLRKNAHIYQQNEMIKGAIHEFNMKSTNLKKSGYSISFKTVPRNNELRYIINNQKFKHQLYPQDDIKHVMEQCTYDIRDPELWTLEHFYSYLQEKQDSVMLKKLSMRFLVSDKTGKNIDTYPKKQVDLPASYEYKDTLGFISKDILLVAYDYPTALFLQSTSGQVILVIFMTALLILCIVNLNRTVRKEKINGKHRELFINNIVHDLKRPVVNQIKICHLLHDTISPEQHSFLKQSEKQLNEMLHTIHQMLLQSTDEHGLRLKLRDFDLAEMLQALTEKKQWNVKEEKEFTILVDFLPTDNIISGDYHFLSAVFQNLVDNALKYSGDRVAIKITCEEIDVQFIRITIQDNGFGISSKNQKQVFERYNRGDHQNNHEIKGHGQGLHYVRTVISAHGGKIDLTSTEGEGTSITITLPRKNRRKKNNIAKNGK